MGFASKVEIDGSTHSLASSLYGTCTTSSGTPSKIVTCPDFDTLITGTTIAVKFVYTNTAANPTLNVNGTGALPIYTDGTNAPGVTPQDSWAANSVVTFTYDGSAWLMTDAMGSALNELRTQMQNQMLNMVYPVGSIYMAVNDTSPASLFGGTWEQIKDKFLLSAGDTYANGATGGAATVTLTAAQSGIPAHSHGHTLKLPNHTHTSNTGGNGQFLGHTNDWNGRQGNTVTNTTGDALKFGPTGNPSSLPSITGGISNNTAADASQAHENMPPYLAVFVWKRTA